MGYVIEISENKMEHLAANAEKMLRYGGKVMQCIEELSCGGNYGERDMDDREEEDWEREETGMRGSYSGRYGNRRDGRGMEMGERRGVRGTGRYSRMY